MERFALVCLGGALGSGARFLLSTWVNTSLGSAFAWGTLSVNLLGSFALGFLVRYGAASSAISPPALLFLTTGVMGGFTTYSTFNQETLNDLGQGRVARAALNVVATVVLCLLGGLAGQWTARAVAGA